MTVWSNAGIIAPKMVNQIGEAQIAAEVARAHVCDFRLYLLAGSPALGFVATALIKPVVAPRANLGSEARGHTFDLERGGLDGRAVPVSPGVGLPWQGRVYKAVTSAAMMFR